ncbi:MAG: formate dehydrogenase [Massilia sp.]
MEQDRQHGVGAGQAAPSSEASPDPARRNFLKAAPLGALAVVAGRAGAAEAAPVAAPAPAAGPRGYHETEHIRTYYRTAAYW